MLFLSNVYTQIHRLFKFLTFFQFLKVMNWKNMYYTDKEVV